MELEQGQIVLCTVKKILGTTVFCYIEGDGEGTLTTSEISPGRIRNLRNYVRPGKKIVCKVLNIKGKTINLSLRRVKQNEKKELLDKLSKEKSYKAILKTVLGKEKAKQVIEKIEQPLLEFFGEVKENPAILEKYVTKEQSKKIIKILETKKEKEKTISNIFYLSNKKENGIIIIKKIISDTCQKTNCKISYLAAGKYRIALKGSNFRKLKKEITTILNEIEKQAKKQDCEFYIEKN